MGAPQGPQVIGSPQMFSPESNTSGPVIGGGGIFDPTAVPPKRSKFPKPLRFGLVIVAVLLLASGYAFGYYIPNKPANVFKTGLSRTGLAIDKVTTAGTDKSKLDAVKKIELSGDVTVNGPSGKQSGSFSSHYDQTQSDSSLTYKPDGSSKAFTVQALTDMPSGQTYPDVYFKVTGLAALGLDQFAPDLLQYDSKWINMSPAFFQSIAPADAAGTQTKQPDEQFTPQDAAEIAKAAVSTTRDYVFTNDPAKNVLVNKSFKGKEKLENKISADHYVVGINKAHAKDYCKALVTNVVATNGYKHLPGVSTATLNDDRDAAIKSCQDEIDTSLKDSDTFDMWVNTGNKLIAKVRFTDTTDKTAYLDIGQSYTKGSTFPVFYVFHSGQSHEDARIDWTTDFDKSTSQLAFNGTFGTGSDKYTVKANAAFKPYNGDLKITKPTDAVPMEKVLQSLGIDPSMLSGASDLPATTTSTNSGIQSKAKDTERQTDLKALQGQLEAYYAEQGMYPTLANLNDAGWRSQNMRGLDSSALADPDGNQQHLTSLAAAHQTYGYNTGTCDVFNGCQSYVLTAILSDGSTYSLRDLSSTTFN